MMMYSVSCELVSRSEVLLETHWAKGWGREGGEVAGALWGLPCVIVYHLDGLRHQRPEAQVGGYCLKTRLLTLHVTLNICDCITRLQ